MHILGCIRSLNLHSLPSPLVLSLPTITALCSFNHKQRPSIAYLPALPLPLSLPLIGIFTYLQLHCLLLLLRFQLSQAEIWSRSRQRRRRNCFPCALNKNCAILFSNNNAIDFERRRSRRVGNQQLQRYLRCLNETKEWARPKKQRKEIERDSARWVRQLTKIPQAKREQTKCLTKVTTLTLNKT